MAKSTNDFGKTEERGDKKDKRSGPCRYCPLSRIGCPMSRFCEKLFQREEAKQ